MEEFAEKLEALLISFYKVMQQESANGDKQVAEKAAQQIINIRKELKLHKAHVNKLEAQQKENTELLQMLTRRLSGVGKTLAKVESDKEVFQRATQNRKKGG